MAEAHVRQQLRDRAVAVLAAGAPSAGGRVFPGRSRPLAVDELPCFLVYTPSESSSVLTMGRAGIQERHVQLQVVAVAAASAAEDDLYAALDSMAAEVEAALLAPAALAPACRQLVLGTTTIEFDPSTPEAPLGRSVIGFTATLHTATGAPTAAR